MKSDVTEIGSRAERHAKGLNAAVEILVVQCVLIVIDSRRGIGHFATHKPDPVVSRIRLDLIYRRPGPRRDGWMHSHGRTKRGKCEVRCAINRILTVGSVVIHVALPGMGLTPLVLKRRDILHFNEVGCALIERGVQITDINANPVRCAVMSVAAMVACISWKRSGERIDPGTRTKQAVGAVLAGIIRIGAARTQLEELTAITGIAAKVALVEFACAERVFHPGLTNLFDPLGVICATTHSIKILRNDRMIRVWQCVKIDRHVAVVAGSRRHRQADLCSRGAELFQVRQVPYDDIGPGHQGRRSRTALTQRGHNHRLTLAVHHLRDLDRLHRRAD